MEKKTEKMWHEVMVQRGNAACFSRKHGVNVDWADTRYPVFWGKVNGAGKNSLQEHNYTSIQ